MEKVCKPKLWDTPLNMKNYKYYALSRYIGTEKTWGCFFKTIKMLEKCKKSIYLIDTNEKEFSQMSQLLEVILQLLNELSYYYENKTITRLVYFNMRSETFSNIKTLLEYKGMLYNHNIPEAEIEKIPFNTILADELFSIKKS